MYGKSFVYGVGKRKVAVGIVLKLCLVCQLITKARNTCSRLWWVEPSQLLNTHPVAFSLCPPEQNRRGYQGSKLNRLVGWDKRKVGGVGGNTKWCEGCHSPPLTSRLMPTRFLSSRNWATFGRPSPQFLLLNVMLYGMEYPYGQFTSALLTVSPFSLLPTPSVTCWGWGSSTKNETQPWCCGGSVL